MYNFPTPLHSIDSDSAWLDSQLGQLDKSRLRLLPTLRIQDLKQTFSILNSIRRDDIRSLATVLNDCSQSTRKKALESLKGKSPETYSKCIEAISEFQMHKAELDPDGYFPCVATQRSVLNRQELKNRCQNCEKSFEEGDDILWKNCKEHALHYQCHAHSTTNEAIALIYCDKCISIQSLPLELLEQITALLPSKDARALKVTPALATVAAERLDPVIYLSSAFSYCISLIAAMADYGCVLSGSRALNFFVPGSVDETSDWDFYVNGYTSCVVGMMNALEVSGVKWADTLGDRVKELLHAEESSISIRVGEAWNAVFNLGRDTDELSNFFRTLRDALRRNINLSRQDEFKVLKRNGDLRFIFPSRELPRTTDEENDPSIASGSDFSVLTGYISKNGRSTKVQLIICHAYGRPQSCLQVISRFHSTPVQCFLGGFGAGHMFYDKTASKTGIIWNPKEESPGRARLRTEALNKYRTRGYDLKQQEFAEGPPILQLGNNGTFYMQYTKLYQQFADFSKNTNDQVHPVKIFLNGLEWGLRNTMWCWGAHGPQHVVHTSLDQVRKNHNSVLTAMDGRYGFPPGVLRAGAMRDRHWYESKDTFRLADYVSTYAPPETSGVKQFGDTEARLDLIKRRLKFSGSLPELLDSSPVSHIL